MESRAYLRRVDDGRELLDPIHAEVRDCEGSSHELFWLELATSGLPCQCQDVLVDATKTLRRGGGGRGTREGWER